MDKGLGRKGSDGKKMMYSLYRVKIQRFEVLVLTEFKEAGKSTLSEHLYARLCSLFYVTYLI
mgnify:CR=1 FL=1